MGDTTRSQTNIFSKFLRLKGNDSKLANQGMALIALLVLVFLVHLGTGGRFLTMTNIGVIINHAIIPTFLVWGLCFIFTTGVMDLSVGAIMIVASTMAGILGLRFGYVGLILGGLLAGLVLEYINCQVYSVTKIPSWVAGLGMAMLYEAGASFYASVCLRNGTGIVNLENQLRQLGNMPYNVVFWVIGFGLAYLLYNYTAVGLNVRAVGSNDHISRKMGVNTEKAKLIGVIVGGLFIGMAGALNESYAGRILPSTGLGSIGMIFEPLAAFLMASAIANVFNIIVGSVFGALALSAIFNALTIFGVPSGTWQEVILGLCVIVVATISQRNKGGVVK
jgi:ribose transport system permease protein